MQTNMSSTVEGYSFGPESEKSEIHTQVYINGSQIKFVGVHKWFSQL